MLPGASDPAYLRRDRPHRRAGRPDGGLRLRSDHSRRGKHSWCSVRKIAQSGFARHVQINGIDLAAAGVATTTSCSGCFSICQERGRALPGAAADRADQRLSPRAACGAAAAIAAAPLMVSVADNGSGSTTSRRTCSIRSSQPSATELALVLHCRQGDRRSRRRHRVRQPAPAHGVPGVSASRYAIGHYAKGHCARGRHASRGRTKR